MARSKSKQLLRARNFERAIQPLVVAAFTLVFVTAGVVWLLSGHAATVTPYDFINRAYCDATTPLECLYADGTSGVAAVVKPYDSTFANEKVNLVGDNACNGDNKVTNLCPFKDGLQLNHDYKGLEIVRLQEANNTKLCYNVDTDTNKVLQGGCGADGHVWVLESTNENNKRWYLINVAASNASNGLTYVLCSQGKNQQVRAVYIYDCNVSAEQWEKH